MRLQTVSSKPFGVAISEEQGRALNISAACMAVDTWNRIVNDACVDRWPAISSRSPTSARRRLVWQCERCIAPVVVGRQGIAGRPLGL